MPNINARYRRVEDGAYVEPGICLICKRAGSQDEQGMIDTQTDMDYYGVVYICSYCILEMAEQYGAASPQAQLNNLAIAEERDRVILAMSERLSKAERILDALGAVHILDMSDSDLHAYANSDSDQEEANEQSVVIDEPVGTGEGDEQETDQRPDSEGPYDFFSLDKSDGDEDEFTL